LSREDGSGAHAGDLAETAAELLRIKIEMGGGSALYRQVRIETPKGSLLCWAASGWVRAFIHVFFIFSKFNAIDRNSHVAKS
jgi:hypothetical protein